MSIVSASEWKYIHDNNNDNEDGEDDIGTKKWIKCEIYDRNSITFVVRHAYATFVHPETIIVTSSESTDIISLFLCTYSGREHQFVTLSWQLPTPFCYGCALKQVKIFMISF